MSARTKIASCFEAALEKMNVSGVTVDVTRPDVKLHGDFSTNCAMALSKTLKKPPRAIAEEILSNLDQTMFEKVEVVGPGFINMFLAKEAIFKFLNDAISDPNYGRWDIGKGTKVQIEFVSANPTGPITVANGRGAPLGDTLATLLQWIGYDVFREFYVNDRGAKVTHLARSLEQRYRQTLGLPWQLHEEAYPGEYLLDIAKEMLPEYGEEPLNYPEDKRLEFFGRQAVSRIIATQEKVFEKFGIKFDRWFSEREMAERGEIEKTLEGLRSAGALYEHEGATFMRSTDYGDDKDFVIIKSSGEPTYTATDIAYHVGKFERGFQKVIDIMGADHHGHVGPMFAGLKALGYDEKRLEFLLYQLVHLFRGGELVKMSKSSGEFVTLEELLDEVGIDAARYYYLIRSSDTQLNFDLDLAKSKTMDNPVYYVQYAHVRCCAIMDDERAKTLDLSKATPFEGDLETDLAKEILDFPEEVKSCALAYAPNRITSYAERLAKSFHGFYHDCRVLQESPEVAARRMLLVTATRKIIASALQILGVSAPERM